MREMAGTRTIRLAGTFIAEATLHKVLVLLGFSFVCTAGGESLGMIWGPALVMPAAIAAFVVLIALRFFAARTPLNLALLYSFAVCEGVVLGAILQNYAAAGYGGIAIDAAATTAVVTLATAFLGLRINRDLGFMRAGLFGCLLGLIVAMLLGALLHIGWVSIACSIAAAALFTAFLVYDFNRIARRPHATEAEAIWFTVAIYLDILNLFLALLRILRAFR